MQQIYINIYFKWCTCDRCFFFWLYWHWFNYSYSCFKVECCGADSPKDWLEYNSTFKQTFGPTYLWPLNCCQRLSNFEVKDREGCLVGKSSTMFTKVKSKSSNVTCFSEDDRQTAKNLWPAGNNGVTTFIESGSQLSQQKKKKNMWNYIFIFATSLRFFEHLEASRYVRPIELCLYVNDFFFDISGLFPVHWVCVKPLHLGCELVRFLRSYVGGKSYNHTFSKWPLYIHTGHVQTCLKHQQGSNNNLTHHKIMKTSHYLMFNDIEMKQKKNGLLKTLFMSIVWIYFSVILIWVL